MEVVMDVDGIAYCAIEIENVRTPPTENFLDTIYLQDGGFGTPVPVLQLVLSDANGTLDEDLNLQDGTKITIKLSRDRTKIKARKFRVFAFEKQTAADGPKMVVTCLYDAPEWVSGVYTESFKGTSVDALSQMAGRAGLKFDGPRSTDDAMTWLNINKTRTSFSEDVVMRAYGGPQSCMARLLTCDGVVRYKDLFEELQKAPMFTYLQNKDESAATGTPIRARETHNASVSGFQTHMMNYGQTQYSHSLDVSGQTTKSSLDAPLMGSSFPINSEVKGIVADRGARITYTGFDPGTSPKPAYNLHQYYEDALYQNMRYLGLWSERLKLLTDDYTEVVPFDVVDYKHSDDLLGEFQDKRLLGGNWIVGGKTIWIKAGHKYSELHFLYRPNLQEAGSTPSTGGDADSKPQATADAAGDRQQELAAATAPAPDIAAQVETPTPAPDVPAVQSATDAMTALADYDTQSNVATSMPLNQVSAPAATLQTEQNLRQSLQNMASSNTELADIATGAVQEGNLNDYVTVKKFDSQVVEYMANASAHDIEYAIRNPEAFKASSMDRLVGDASELVGMNLRNIVSAATGEHFRAGDIVGDVLDGGMWGDSLSAAGILRPDIQNVPADAPWLSKVGNAGAKFLYDMTGVGISQNGVAIDPRKLAESVEAWARGTTSQDYLAREGFRAFQSTFGNLTPEEADTALEKLSKLAADVALRYTESELIYDHGFSDYEIQRAGRDVLLTFGDPSVAPLVDTVTDIYNYNNYVDVSTQKSASTWADYFSMGVRLQDSVERWNFPFKFPEDGATQISNNTGNFSNQLGGFEKWT